MSKRAEKYRPEIRPAARGWRWRVVDREENVVSIGKAGSEKAASSAAQAVVAELNRADQD